MGGGGGGWVVVVVVARVSFFSSYTTVQELTPARFTTILTHFLFKSFVLKNLNRFLTFSATLNGAYERISER